MTTTRGKRLRAAREEKGFRSADAAAIAIGVPATTYRAHERAQSRGGNHYHLKYAKLYAKKLRGTPAGLLARYGRRPSAYARRQRRRANAPAAGSPLTWRGVEYLVGLAPSRSQR